MAARLVIVLLVAFAALASVPASAQITVISYTLSIGSFERFVGEQGSVSLDVTDISGGPVGAWDILIEYDPEVMSVVACTASKSSVCEQPADNAIRVMGASPMGLTEDTTLSSITFQCATVGSTPLSLTALGGGIPEIIQEIEIVDGVIACNEQTEATATPQATPTREVQPSPLATPLLSLPKTGDGNRSTGSARAWLVAGLAAAAGFILVWTAASRLRR